MKINRLVAALLAMAVIMAVGTLVLAEGGRMMPGARMGMGAGNFKRMTDEDKAQMEAARAGRQAEMKQAREAAFDAMRAKWAALPQEEKDGIIALIKEEIALQVKIIDKRVEMGVLAPEQAEQMKANLEKRLASLDDEDFIPVMFCSENNRPQGQAGFRGGGRGGKMAPPQEQGRRGLPQMKGGGQPGCGKQNAECAECKIPNEAVTN